MKTSVTPTRCAPTLKDPMSVAVLEALRVTGKTVQVFPECIAWLLNEVYSLKSL